MEADETTSGKVASRKWNPINRMFKRGTKLNSCVGSGRFFAKLEENGEQTVPNMHCGEVTTTMRIRRSGGGSMKYLTKGTRNRVIPHELSFEEYSCVRNSPARKGAGSHLQYSPLDDDIDPDLSNRRSPTRFIPVREGFIKSKAPLARPNHNEEPEDERTLAEVPVFQGESTIDSDNNSLNCIIEAAATRSSPVEDEGTEMMIFNPHQTREEVNGTPTIPSLYTRDVLIDEREGTQIHEAENESTTALFLEDELDGTPIHVLPTSPPAGHEPETPDENDAESCEDAVKTVLVPKSDGKGGFVEVHPSNLIVEDERAEPTRLLDLKESRECDSCLSKGSFDNRPAVVVSVETVDQPADATRPNQDKNEMLQSPRETFEFSKADESRPHEDGNNDNVQPSIETVGPSQDVLLSISVKTPGFPNMEDKRDDSFPLKEISFRKRGKAISMSPSEQSFCSNGCFPRTATTKKDEGEEGEDFDERFFASFTHSIHHAGPSSVISDSDLTDDWDTEGYPIPTATTSAVGTEIMPTLSAPDNAAQQFGQRGHDNVDAEQEDDSDEVKEVDRKGTSRASSTGIWTPSEKKESSFTLWCHSDTDNTDDDNDDDMSATGGGARGDKHRKALPSSPSQSTHVTSRNSTSNDDDYNSLSATQTDIASVLEKVRERTVVNDATLDLHSLEEFLEASQQGTLSDSDDDEPLGTPPIIYSPMNFDDAIRSVGGVTGGGGEVNAGNHHLVRKLKKQSRNNDGAAAQDEMEGKMIVLPDEQTGSDAIDGSLTDGTASPVTDGETDTDAFQCFDLFENAGRHRNGGGSGSGSRNGVGKNQGDDNYGYVMPTPWEDNSRMSRRSEEQTNTSGTESGGYLDDFRTDILETVEGLKKLLSFG